MDNVASTPQDTPWANVAPLITVLSIYPFYIELWRRGLEETYKWDGNLGTDVVEEARGRGCKSQRMWWCWPLLIRGAGHF